MWCLLLKFSILEGTKMTNEIQIGPTAPIAKGHDISSWSCEVQNSICELVEQVSKLKQQARSKAMWVWDP